MMSESEDSIHSSSSSSSDMVEDATSNSSSSSISDGPLYQLSDLMAQLPIKRGLSKFYNGKSQTFTSLSCAKSVEDLSKKERMTRKRRNMSPKATISKKKPSSSSPSFGNKNIERLNNGSLDLVVVIDHTCFRPLLISSPH